MRCKSLKFKENKIYVIPIGDIHIGDKSFTKESRSKLEDYLKWVKSKPNAYIFLMGDIVNCATRDSASNPFEQNMDLKQQIKEAVKYFEPVKDKIIGAIDGNHELRLADYTGYSPTISICDKLNIDYFQHSAVVLFKLGCHQQIRGKKASPRGTFVGYFHHTTGGGATTGGKMNRVDKLKNIVCDADFYCGAHNHGLGSFHSVVYKVNTGTNRIEKLRQILIDCGGYLEYHDSYAEKKMLPPLKIGSPKVHLALKQGSTKVYKDIHVSL